MRAGLSGEALGAEFFLEVLAVRAALLVALRGDSQAEVREAVEAGATWRQIARARGVRAEQARADFRTWVEAQTAAWEASPDPAGGQVGIDPRHRATLRALADRND